MNKNTLANLTVGALGALILNIPVIVWLLTGQDPKSEWSAYVGLSITVDISFGLILLFMMLGKLHDKISE